MSFRRPLFAVFRKVYGAIYEHKEDGWIKVAPGLLPEVLSCCALLLFAETVVGCSNPSHAGGSAAEAAEFEEYLELE